MKTCPKCSEAHTKTGTYCSRSCANSRSFSDESLKKKSISQIQALAKKTPDERMLMRIKAGLATKNKATERRKMASSESLGHDARRRKIIEEQANACLCGITEWLGKSIVLELDHIDGDNKNNVRDNLRALCPNCHSQTPTWRGRKNASIA